jgi:hypothetical protein
MRLAFILALAVLSGAFLGHAEGVRNGNEFALNYSRADKDAKRALRLDYENKLITFRFLKVVAIASNAVPNGLPVYTTVEPSSDYRVILHAQGPVSRTVCAAVGLNDCVTANGRLLPLGTATNTFVLDPAVLRSKDRDAPKGEKELLPEIDPTAVK